MRQNIKIAVIIVAVLIILASIGAYLALTPHYKSIEVNGYTIEVPENNVNVTSVNDNYKIYEDKEKNITIKSYAINNINETNYTAAEEIINESKSDNGENCTYNNITLLNKSGTYTYFDINAYQIIEITGNNPDEITHLVKTLNKTEIKPSDENATIDLTTLSDDSTENNNTNTSTKKTTTKSSSNSKSSSKSQSKYKDDEIYDVPVPGSGGKTVKARWTGTNELGARYEEVGTGKIIYH